MAKSQRWISAASSIPFTATSTRRICSGMCLTTSVEQEAIRELANLLDETGLSEIEIEKSGLRIRVARMITVAVLGLGAMAVIYAIDRVRSHSMRKRLVALRERADAS